VSPLQLSFSVADKVTTIILKGSLNEYSSALDGVEVNPNYDLILDLKDVKAINSLGTRNFRNWIHGVQCQRLRLFHCPRVFVNQMNLVEGFLPPKSEVESFFVPYYSEGTDEEMDVLFTKFLEYKQVNGSAKITFPDVRDKQGNKMIVDVIENQYFRFLEKYS
jgi:anti-anti-sigma regulatory factor